MRDLVRVARDEGVPTVIWLHDVGLAREFADRIVGIVGRRTVFDGPPVALTDEALNRIYRWTPTPTPIAC